MGKDIPTTPYEKLLDHSFVGSIIQNSRPVFAARSKAVEEAVETEEKFKTSKKQSNKSQSTKVSMSIDLTREQEYQDEVFYYMWSLIKIVERLDEISIYLKRFPNSPTFKKQGITLHRWVQYHYSGYLTSAVTIYDTALLLTNVVFMLGLNPKNCTDDTVTKNRRVQRTKVTAALNKLKEATKHYREPRNLYVHRGESPSLGKLDEYESILWMHRAQERLEMKIEPRVQIKIVEISYRFERRKLIQTVRDEKKAIADAARGLFDSLEPVYSTITTQLK